jgi:hypothetical protein
VLAYGHAYDVQIDSSAIVAQGFAGFDAAHPWRFRTCPAPPDHSRDRLVVAADGSMRYLEFASTMLSNGLPADVSSRHPSSRQLDPSADAALIRNYREPAYVLGGWNPAAEVQ